MSRTRDPELLRVLHLRWKECALCFSIGFGTNFEPIGLSLHHISNSPRDDIEDNLVMLCGDGVRGCHGLVTANELNKCRELAVYLRESRPDSLAYLEATFPVEGAENWLQRVLRG